METGKGTTEKLSQFLIETQFKDLPEEVIYYAKRAFIDTVACILGAIRDPVSKIMLELVKSEGCKPICGVIGSGLRTSALMASLANGAMGHALDLDDTNNSMRGHPTIVTLPAAFALGEELGSSGKEILAAYVLGFEIGAKIGKGVNMEHYLRGWHCTLALGTFSAAAASAKLLKLDKMHTKAALGIAASMSSGLGGNFGSMTKPFHAGRAASNGVLAAKLAQKGLTANMNIIEVEHGFADLFCGYENCDFSQIRDHLGDPWDIISPGVVPKLYTSCSLSHPAIDIILDLKREKNLMPDEIKSLRCGVTYRCVKTLPYHSPRTGHEGKFSMEYPIAIALVDGKADIEQFFDEKVSDPEVQSMLKRIEVYTHPELTNRDSLEREFTQIDIELKSGEKIARRLAKQKGDPANPLSSEEIYQKYYKYGEGNLSPDAVDKSLDLLKRFEELPNLSQIMKLLCKV